MKLLPTPKIKKIIQPLIDIADIKKWIISYHKYSNDWKDYSQMPSSEHLNLTNAYPCLFDNTPTTPFDSHYFFQGIWALKKIKNQNPNLHIDIGSSITYVGMLTPFTKVAFLDYRPLKISLDNYIPLQGDITHLPFSDNSIASISCLHVAEHIGLGRYGDKLNPLGTIQAINELQRALAPNGNLYFSLPVGKPRTCFNAHRIHDPEYIIKLFDQLSLHEFSCVDDTGSFRPNITPQTASKSAYSCGLFHFKK